MGKTKRLGSARTASELSPVRAPFMGAAFQNPPANAFQRSGETPENMTCRAFRLRADTVDEKERKVQAVIATEDPVLVFDMRNWEFILEVLRIDGIEIPADDQLPLLDTHDRSSITKMLGSTRTFTKEGGELLAWNHYDEDADSIGVAEKAWSLVKGRHLRDNSVGYEVLAFVDIAPGETATVEGKTYTAPTNRTLRITTESRLKENSNCPIGADPSAKMRKDAPTTEPNHPTRNHKEKSVNKELLAYLRSCGLAEGSTEAEAIRFFWDLTAEQRSAAPSQLDDSTKPSTAAAEPAPAPAQRSADPVVLDVRQTVLDEMAAARQAEGERIATIRSEAQAAGVSQECIERCITDGSDIAAARAAFLADVRTQRTSAGPMINVPNRGNHTRSHLSAAILMRCGAGDDVLRQFGDDDMVNQTMDNLRHATLLDICRMACAMEGVDGSYNPTELLRAGFSTGTLPVILGDVAHKMMLKGFGQAGDTWRAWAATKSVSDFKDNNLFRLNLNGRLEKVGNGGEVTYMSRSEEATKVAADSYAKNLSITRKDMINDDAGAFADAAKILGRKAGASVADLVYTILLANVLNDGNSTDLFSATAHKDKDGKAIVNLQTSSALNYANLGSAIALFRKFREYNGDPIDVNPAHLLVPPELETVARELTSSDATIAWGGDTSTKNGNKNVYKQYGLNPVAESRLSNTRFTGYSATSWYLMPAATDADVVTVAFLNGVETPTLNQFGLTADRLGYTWQVLHDFGAAATDKYAVKSTA